jgi:hypothetical protein
MSHDHSFTLRISFAGARQNRICMAVTYMLTEVIPVSYLAGIAR